MNIYDTCREALKVEYAKGITQAELGKRAGISHAHVNRLLNGRSSFATLKMETMLKLLPMAKITVGDMHVINNGENHGYIGGVMEAPEVYLPGGEAEAFRSGVIMEIIDLEIEMAAKDAVLRVLRNYRRRA